MACRHRNPVALIREIERLKALGHSSVAIGKKVGVSDTFISSLLKLVKAGEERLVEAALAGKVPITIAISIAKTDGPEAQRELLKAYEDKTLTFTSLRVVKRLIEQRRLCGKSRASGPRNAGQAPRADTFVTAYRREADRQKKLIRKAAVAEEKLLFIITALKTLLADNHFTRLLRAEKLNTMPEYLAERIAEALDVKIEVIISRMNLLVGIHADVVELLKDKQLSDSIFHILRKVKPLRQIEMAELMASANNFTKGYADALLKGTISDDLVNPNEPKKAKGMTPEEIARMEQKMATISGEFKAIEATYGETVLNLTLAKNYVVSLLGNAKISRFLATRHSDYFAEFQKHAATDRL